MLVTINTATPITRRLTYNRCPLAKITVKKKVSPTMQRNLPLEAACAIRSHAHLRKGRLMLANLLA
jgi:hypothetical protein